MRTFYIFNIKKEFFKLTADFPYNLYNSLEHIYYLNKKDIYMAFKMFEALVDPINSKKVNKILFEKYKDNDNYIKYSNKHFFRNYFTDEETSILIKNTHLVLRSSVLNPHFLKDLYNNSHFFICDFENKDYFWINQLSNKSLVSS